MTDRLRNMPHTRLVRLTQGEMPEWFVTAVSECFRNMDYGVAYRSAAQGLWDVVVEGYSEEDRELTVRGEKFVFQADPTVPEQGIA